MQSALIEFVVEEGLLLLDAEVEVLVEELGGGRAVVEVGVDEGALAAAWLGQNVLFVPKIRIFSL